MKTKFLYLILIIFVFMLYGCGEYSSPISIVSVEKIGQNEEGFIYEITFYDNSSYQFTVPTGEDGVTPQIGENGNWWIGSVDTGELAHGFKGDKGEDGLTPYIGENENWWIGETDTGISAQGIPGQNGKDGLTPYIGENGNWWIGEVDTNTFAGNPSSIIQTGDFRFSVNSDGESYYLVSYNGNDRFINIPSNYNGYPVTAIGQGAFMDNTIIESVVTNNVLVIEKEAFKGAINLKNVQFDKVEVIENDAFYRCSSLEALNFPSTLTRIGDQAFSEAIKVSTIRFQNNSQLKSIGDKAFFWNTGLVSIDFGLNPSIEKIGLNAFHGASSLESLYIPNTITSIEPWAFAYASSLSNIVFEENSILTIIRECTFLSATSMEQIMLPDSITTIGVSAFDSSNLRTIFIPKGVDTIGLNAFANSHNLIEVRFENDSQLSTIREGAFSNCTSLSSVIIPKSVKTISSGIFTLSTGVVVYAETTSKPIGWDIRWNYTGGRTATTYWGGEWYFDIDSNPQPN